MPFRKTNTLTYWYDRARGDAPASKDEVARMPRSVQAVYLKPLKRKAQHGYPSCDLQLRSYSVRNVEFYADFALRAAYYLHLPALGPIPLPRITERWTVPRSNFVNKKSQENFERITLRRLIQVLDGHPETVEIWLAFLRRHAYYGVGMKANIWEHESLGTFIWSFWAARFTAKNIQGSGKLWTSAWRTSRRIWSRSGPISDEGKTPQHQKESTT